MSADLVAPEVTYCNSCLDVMDDRYNDDEGCVNGSVYGPCGDDNCGGCCEYCWPCDCTCHITEGAL